MHSQQVRDTDNRGGILVQNSGSGSVIVLPVEPPVDIDTIPRNPYFKGRKIFLKEIVVKFQAKKSRDPKLLVLCGSGGIGKTSIAYEVALSIETSVKIRIRTESFDVLKEDYRQLALLLHIDPADKNLKEIVDLVNQELLAKYKDGIIVFDNVESYKSPVNGDNSVGSLTRLFPKGDKFWILATTRNNEHWPSDSVLRVPELEQRDAIILFQSICDTQVIDTDRLLTFLNEKLGHSPLAICQAASHMKHHALTLEDYIGKFDTALGSSTSLSDIEALLPEFTCEGETPAIRRAIFTTYDINIESIVLANTAFIVPLRYAAFMHPDAIAQTELYEVSSRTHPGFNSSETHTAFKEAIRKTSLIEFMPLPSQDIAMHRIIQMVLLLKARSQAVNLSEILLRLFTYVSERYFESRVAYVNFAYLLRNIQQQKLFFDAVPVSSPAIVNGFLKAANRYIEENEILKGISFMIDFINYLDRNLNVAQYDTVKQHFLAIFRDQFDITNINQDWLVEVLNAIGAIDKSFQIEVIDILFRHEKTLTGKPKYFEQPFYYETVKALSDAIILVLGNTPEERNQLSEAHYILGRAYRENAKGINTELQGKIKLKKSKEETLSNLETYMTKVRKNILSEIGIINEGINLLESDFTEKYSNAKKNLKCALTLQNDEPSVLLKTLASIQIIRLHKLLKIEDEDCDISYLAKVVVDNATVLHGHYDDDITYCQSLKKRRSFSPADDDRVLTRQRTDQGEGSAVAYNQHGLLKPRALRRSPTASELETSAPPSTSFRRRGYG